MNPKHFGLKTLDLKNKEYEKWVKTKPCLIPGCYGKPQFHHCWHCRSNDYLGVPLCETHHMPGHPGSYHTLEHEEFEKRHNLNLSWEIINLLVEWNAKKL